MISNRLGLSLKIHCKNKQSKTTPQFILNNCIITDLHGIANEFNAYFVDIGRLLSEQIHSDSSNQD